MIRVRALREIAATSPPARFKEPPVEHRCASEGTSRAPDRTTISSVASVRPHRGATQTRAALALGLCLVGSPVFAQTVPLGLPTAASTEPLFSSTPTVSIPPALGTLPPAEAPLEPMPLPESAFHIPPQAMSFTSVNHFDIGATLQGWNGITRAYGDLQAGHTWTLNLSQGRWHSETSLDATVQGQLGQSYGPTRNVWSVAAGAVMGERISFDLNDGFSIYGRGSFGAQIGTGTSLDMDSPLNDTTLQGAFGLQHSDAMMRIYAEPFFTRVNSFAGGVSHDQTGFRIGVDRFVTADDLVSVQADTAYTTYDIAKKDAHSFELQAGWSHRAGAVWWGPQIAFKHTEETSENRITAGIHVNF